MFCAAAPGKDSCNGDSDRCFSIFSFYNFQHRTLKRPEIVVEQRAIIMKFWVSNHGAMAVDKLPILESILMSHSLESGLTPTLIKTESNLDSFFIS